MSGADIQWTEVEVSPVALNESVDSRVLPPGQLVEAFNCEFTSKDGSLRKRPGTVLVANPPEDAVGRPLTLDRLVSHERRQQLLGVDLVGSSLTDPSVYSIPDASSDGDNGLDPVKAGNACHVLTRRLPVATDLESDIMCDMAYVHTSGTFGYFVYGIVHMQSHNISVKVVKAVKNADCIEAGETVLDVNVPYGRLDGDAIWVQAAPSLDRYVMIAWGHQMGSPTPDSIFGVVVDCGTGSTPTVSARQLIGGSIANILEGFDLCESTYTSNPTQPSWVLVYREMLAGEDALRVRRLQGVGPVATPWNVQWVGAARANNPVAITCFELNQQVWVNWYDRPAAGETPPEPEWRYAVFDSATGLDLVSGASIPWCTSADVGLAEIYSDDPISGIAMTGDADEMMLFHSQNADDNSLVTSVEQPWGFRDRPITRWARARLNGVVGSIRQKRGVRLYSKPWRDPVYGRYWAWGIARNISQFDTLAGSGGGFGGQNIRTYDNTALLMRFVEEPALPGPIESKAEAYAAVGGRIAQEPLEAFVDVGSVIVATWSFVPRSVTYPNYIYEDHEHVRAVGRHTILNLRYVPTERKSGPWDVVFRVEESEAFPAGYGRYQHVPFGGSVYMAGGALTQWDGDRLQENCFYVPPNIQAVNASTGGDWPSTWAESTMHFQAVYETVLNNGERVRSGTSNVATITLNGDADLGTQPTNTVTLYLEPMTLSMRRFGGDSQEYQAPRTLVTVYCSVTPAGTQLHRFFKFEAGEWENFVCDPDAVTPIIYQLDGTSGPFANIGGMGGTAENEVIYNDSGELDNDHPYGGCSCLEVHKDRLWVGGGDDPEVLWYSKERVDGRPAEFALGQQVRIPSTEVIAIKSLDDALIVLGRHSIYAIYGDGPNATGDPASGFFSVVPISTVVGCNGPSSVAVIPQGIIFRSEQGFHLLDRGRQLHNIGAPIQDTASLVKVPIASVTIPQLQQARFMLGVTGAAGEEFGGDFPIGSDVAVYDWDAQKWAIWRYNFANSADGEPWVDEDVVDQKTLGDTLYILCSDGTVHREDPNVFSDSGAAYRQRVKTGWLSFGRVQGYKRMRKFGILTSPNPWANYSLLPQPDDFPYGLKVGMDFNYAESGFNAERAWNSVELGQFTSQSGVTWTRVTVPYQKQPSIRLTLNELPAARYVLAVNFYQLIGVDTTGGNNVLRIRIDNQAPISTVTLASDDDWTLADFIVALQAELDATFGVDQLKVYQDLNSADDLRIETVQASYLEIDSVANGSTLNTAIGLNVAGEVAAASVSPNDQSGFILHSLAFEIGMIPGIKRLSAAQSR